MYSNIQSINSTPKPLETEATDAHLRDKAKNTDESVHHDPENQGGGYLDEFDNDTNIFSINALIYFLEDFLEARLSSKLNEANVQDVSSIAPWIKAGHSNVNEKPLVQPKKAASAYAHGSDVIKGAAQKDNIQTVMQRHNNEKVSDIYHLLRDLRDLRDDGISQLKLHKSATFLDGVYSAVQVAKLESAG